MPTAVVVEGLGNKGEGGGINPEDRFGDSGGGGICPYCPAAAAADPKRLLDNIAAC